MSTVFLLLAIVEASVVAVGHFMNKKHSISQFKHLDSLDNGSELPTQVSQGCECGCGIRSSAIDPMYNNPIVYSTGLPTAQSFLLMMAGIVDWGMAMTFFKHQYLNKSWEELAVSMMMGEGGEEMESMAEMEAESYVLWQLMVIFLLQLIAGVIARRIDRRDLSSQVSHWRDEFFGSPTYHDSATCQ